MATFLSKGEFKLLWNVVSLCLRGPFKYYSYFVLISSIVKMFAQNKEDKKRVEEALQSIYGPDITKEKVRYIDFWLLHDTQEIAHKCCFLSLSVWRRN